MTPVKTPLDTPQRSAPRRAAPCRSVRAGRRPAGRLPQAGPGVPTSRRDGRRTRLTRRGRLLLVLVVATVLSLAFSLGRVSTTADTSPAERAQLERVVVQPGDTLWSLAVAAVPDVDPRVTVDRIEDLNGLAAGPGGGIAVGQELVLPSR